MFDLLQNQIPRGGGEADPEMGRAVNRLMFGDDIDEDWTWP
eukprot:CAMPEP_0172202772 /NCGR_PEP_ID=MMETSP1050-20130122/30868_1 /TAXON_ID=233186 /ORGANISM="Cryptomonas curvata, Strain CCAP979/52" /LENGTH=40 /DNA_ID= /DNA_START= /DNA_END= /DNA_ORIENTATION=